METGDRTEDSIFMVYKENSKVLDKRMHEQTNAVS